MRPPAGCCLLRVWIWRPSSLSSLSPGDQVSTAPVARVPLRPPGQGHGKEYFPSNVMKVMNISFSNCQNNSFIYRTEILQRGACTAHSTGPALVPSGACTVNQTSGCNSLRGEPAGTGCVAAEEAAKSPSFVTAQKSCCLGGWGTARDLLLLRAP